MAEWGLTVYGSMLKAIHTMLTPCTWLVQLIEVDIQLGVELPFLLTIGSCFHKIESNSIAPTYLVERLNICL